MISSYVYRAVAVFRSLNSLGFIVLWLVLIFAANLAVAIALSYFATTTSEIYKPVKLLSMGWVTMLLVGSVVAPALETFVYQVVPRVILKKLRCPTALFILISAALFGASHSFEPLSFVLFSTLGMVLAVGYVVRDFRGGRPGLHVAAVHGLKNLISTFFFFAI